MAQYCASQLSTKVDSQCDKLVTVIKVHAFIVISITSRTKRGGGMRYSDTPYSDMHYSNKTETQLYARCSDIYIYCLAPRVGLASISFWSRSLLIVCDHVRSKERLIAINRPIATPLGGTTVFWVSTVAAAAWPITNTAWGKQEGGQWVSQLQQQHRLCWVDRPPLIDNRTICCPSCHPLLDWVSVSHCSTLTEKFPEDDTASANTTAWKVAVSERVPNKILQVVRSSSE